MTGTLTKVRRILASIPAIGAGGCAIAALAMKRYLDVNKITPEDFKFVYLYSYDDLADYNSNSKILANTRQDGKDLTATPSSCSHIIIYANGLYMDAKKPIDVSLYSFVHHINNEVFVVNSINNIRQWNDTFDRRYVKIIAYKLAINLSDIVV